MKRTFTEVSRKEFINETEKWIISSEEWLNRLKTSSKKKIDASGKSNYTKEALESRKYERDFGNSLLKKYFEVNSETAQWTTTIGQMAVKLLLEERGENVWLPEKKGNCVPDLETNDCVYEVKSRTYTTQGTAGEKIFGPLWKYAEIPRLYNKPLKIVLIGYQEYEAIHKFKLFDSDLPEEKRRILEFFKDEMKIEYIKGSSLIN